jgi:hypothetical protein
LEKDFFLKQKRKSDTVSGRYFNAVYLVEIGAQVVLAGRTVELGWSLRQLLSSHKNK